MKNEIWKTTLRFNLKNPTMRKAAGYLDSMDKEIFRSYSKAIAHAIVFYFEHYYRLENDPYFETREKEDAFAERIVADVGEAIKEELPHVLGDCLLGMLYAGYAGNSVASPFVQTSTKNPDKEILQENETTSQSVEMEEDTWDAMKDMLGI